MYIDRFQFNKKQGNMIEFPSLIAAPKFQQNPSNMFAINELGIPSHPLKIFN